jgi:hypothetical protein
MAVDTSLVLIMAGSTNRHEPRWPALLALFAVGGLRLAIPSFLSFGPDWLLLIVVSFLMIPTVLARRGGNLKLNQVYLRKQESPIGIIGGAVVAELFSHRSIFEIGKDIAEGDQIGYPL